MKIKLNSGEFRKLKIAGRIIPAKTTLESTENFLFEVKQNKIKVTATDAYGTLVVKNIETVSANEEATFAIPAKLFLQTLSAIPNQLIDMKIEDGNITVDYAQGSCMFPSPSAENYPNVNPGNTIIEIPISTSMFIDGAKQVLTFAGNDQLLTVMYGIYVELKDGKITFVATDAQLLATKEFELEHSADSSAIVPPNAIKMIIDVFKECKTGENATMKICSRHITVETDEYQFIYRLIEGRYPNFRAVIPKIDKVIEVNTAELINTLKRVTLFSSESSLVVFDMSEDNKIEVFSEDIDYRRSIRETIEPYAFFNLKIGMNGARLITLLETIKSERCVLSFRDEKTAVVFKPADDSEVTLIQMPMLINQ